MARSEDPVHFARNASLTAGLLAGMALALQPAPVGAAEGDFLKGETVHFLVGYSPGGGYDTYARMLAPHFEKRTGATVVVENRPGGGGTTALNQLFRAKPDGLTMQMLNGESAIIAQLTKQPGVAYDMGKVSLYGRVLEEPHFMIVNPKFPDSLRELIASGKKIKFSAGSRTDNLGDYAAVTCEALKINCQIITGYKGSKEAGLAVMNGEADALTISETSAINYSKGGRTKIVVTIARKRSAERPDIPTVYEMFQLSPEGKWWFDFRLGIKAIGRVVVGTPGIPQDRLQTLQRVWREILTDPAVIAEGAKTKHDVEYEAPDKLNVRDLLERLPADKLREVNEVILKKFS
ncbi:MAG: tripartite tricarboxylate transporter substrate-binding protein [Betaproteobacteria bacterium]|nr:tripartite tricarboxylate transporter substrate-binding protein [Betaproteobacteria bacterium]